MGQCYDKASPAAGDDSTGATATTTVLTTPSAASSSWPSPYPHGVAPSLSPGRSKTPSRLFRWAFPPPSPAKHIKVALARRHDTKKPKEGTILEDGENNVAGNGDGEVTNLDKRFGYGKNFGAKYDVIKEVRTFWSYLRKGQERGDERRGCGCLNHF